MVGWGCGGVTGLGMVAATWLTMGVVAAKDAGLAGEAPVKSTSPLSLCAMVVATRRTATTGRRTETRGTQPVGWRMGNAKDTGEKRRALFLYWPASRCAFFFLGIQSQRETLGPST